MTRRVCHDCGATQRDAAFPGSRKPRLRVDRCSACVAAPLSAEQQRVAARKQEIKMLRLAKNRKGRQYRAPRPFWTAPLFRELRP